MGSAQYNKLSSSATTESGPDHTLDLEQNPGSTFSEQAHTGGATAASGFTEANVAIDEGPDYDQQKHKMGLSKLIKGLRRTAMGRLHFRRARGPGTLKRVTILALLITVLLVVFRYYHTTTVAINQWRYHEDPRNDLAKSVINILSSSENKLVELNLDKTMLKRPEKKRLSKWRHKYTMTTFDPRLPASLYVSKLADYLESHESSLDPTLELEFSWKDWTDFNRRLLPSDKYLSAHHGQPIENCQQFIDETGFSNPQTCRDLTADEINALPDATYPHFKITGVSDPRIARDARVLMAGTYLYYTMPAPERIVFVDTGSKRALSVRTVESGGRKPLLDTLVSEFKRSHAETEEISISEQMERLNSAIDKTTLGSDSEKYADLDVLKVIPERVDRENSPVDLSTDMFQWEENADDVKRAAQGKLEQIESKCRGENNAAVKARDTISPNDDSLKELTCNPKYSNMLRLNSELVEFITANPNNGYPKFFHEAGYTPIGHDNGAHLDWRFISSRKLPEYESKSGLHRLMRSWLRFTRTVGIDTWIAHGSLLGYYFNGMTLAWDFDHDVQVTMEALTLLARKYRHSLVVDVSHSTVDETELSDMGMGEYWLDVGNSFFYRAKGNGRNAIDARFIDIHTGLFIDITALAFAKQRPNKRAMGKNLSKEHKKFLSDNALSEKDFKQFLMDRNNHYYLQSEIVPLIPALFEGEQGFIPQKSLTILSREYMQYRKNWSWENHTWRTRYRSWVSDAVCSKNDKEGNSCSNNPEVRFDDLFQKDYIDKHLVQKKQLENAGDSIIVKAPNDAKPYPKVLRPDVTLMKLATERDL